MSVSQYAQLLLQGIRPRADTRSAGTLFTLLLPPFACVCQKLRVGLFARVCVCVLSSLCVRIVVVAAVAKLFRAITAALNFLFSIFHCKAREAKRIDTVPHAALTWTALLLHCIPHTDTRPQTDTHTHAHTLKHLRLLMAGK